MLAYVELISLIRTLKAACATEGTLPSIIRLSLSMCFARAGLLVAISGGPVGTVKQWIELLSKCKVLWRALNRRTKVSEEYSLVLVSLTAWQGA